MIAYRIVEIRNGKILSLFHGTKGSREIVLDQWNPCDHKDVMDGSRGKVYRSGWHFLLSKEDCEKFLMSMFRKKDNRYVVRCEVRGNIRPKHPDGKGKPCWLADEILIRSTDICQQ